jgi:uncharacterized protein YebE (UPF0316 family)
MVVCIRVRVRIRPRIRARTSVSVFEFVVFLLHLLYMLDNLEWVHGEHIENHEMDVRNAKRAD